MSGKSALLRQTALITLMAHMGSFVPASDARIPLTDKIFTRVGASDNLSGGESTFMVEIQYKGRNINEVLQMTVETAAEFFSVVPVVARKLQTLLEVGLGYITLGQSATTLSGGEAQRVKLSLELSKRDTGRTLYILDEPTTGLHFQDIDLLLTVLHRLRDHGNTVVVIEHNLDVIKTADWIIDLGPEGGDGGGRIIAEGSPEAVASNKESFTGEYLRPILSK